MAKWVLDRGPGPLGVGAGRVWAKDIMTRKKAGLAGLSLLWTVFFAERPA